MSIRAPRRRVDDAADHARPAMNMTPMIDVTFQLMIVFLCSMKFRTLDMKIDALLPPVGASPVVQAVEVVPRIRVRLAEGGPGDSVRLRLADEAVGATDEGEGLWARLETRMRDLRTRDPRLVAEIDAAPGVPHGVVMRALDTLVGAGMEDIRFRGTP